MHVYRGTHGPPRQPLDSRRVQDTAQTEPTQSVAARGQPKPASGNHRCCSGRSHHRTAPEGAFRQHATPSNWTEDQRLRPKPKPSGASTAATRTPQYEETTDWVKLESEASSEPPRHQATIPCRDKAPCTPRCKSRRCLPKEAHSATVAEATRKSEQTPHAEASGPRLAASCLTRNQRDPKSTPTCRSRCSRVVDTPKRERHAETEATAPGVATRPTPKSEARRWDCCREAATANMCGQAPRCRAHRVTHA